MNPSAEHIIRSAKLILALDEQKNSIEHQNAISALFNGMLIPAMNAIFDRLSSDERVVKIDKIEIDIGVVEMKGSPDGQSYFQNNVQEMIKNPEKVLAEFEKILEELIQKYIRNGEAEVNSMNDSNEEILLYFLENGRLPWNSRYKSTKELFSAIADITFSDEFGKKMSALFELANVKNRLFALTDAPLQSKIITALLFHLSPHDWSSLKDNFAEIFRDLIGNQQEDNFKELLGELINSEQSGELDPAEREANELEFKKIEDLLTSFQEEMNGFIKELEQTQLDVESELNGPLKDDSTEEATKDPSQGYSDEAILLYFLQYGRLPANGRYTALTELFSALSGVTFSFGFGKKLIGLAKQANVKKRLVGLADAAIQTKIVEVLLSQAPKAEESEQTITLSDFKKADLTQRAEMLDQLLNKFVEIENNGEEKEITESLSSGYDDNTDYIHVKNAGIVLAHPFLTPVFKDVALIENKSFAGIDEQWRAVYMLHYIATGENIPSGRRFYFV
jgi:hypothetical protein